MSASAAPRLASLGTTLRDARPAWAAALAVLLYDLLTLAPDLTAYDSPELALAAVQLGLSHPIGQPLHTLLGAAFAHLPGVPPLWGLGLLSALAHALTVLPAASLAEQLAPPVEASDPRSRLAAPLHAVALAAILLVAPIWECATRVEVYTLSSFGVTWAAAHAASMAWDRELSPTRALVLGLALGLTASANAYHAMLAALAFAPLAVRVLSRRLDQPAEPTVRAVGRALLGGLAGLVPYLYVPLVGGRTDVVVWGAPTDAESLAAYFRGTDYGHNRGTTLGEMLDHFAQWIAWAARTPVLALLVLGGLAHVAMGRERGLGREASAVLSVGSIALLCSHRVFHVEITDYQNYLAPALVLAGAGLAAGIGSALSRPAVAAPAFATLVLACVAAPPALWSRTRGHDHALGVAARGALAEAPDGALVVVASDHWAAPLLYLQEVERLRPDVVVIIEGLASSSWYWAHVRRRHPDLARFELAGPDGRQGRLRRLLEASSERSVLVESASIAEEVGLPICDVGFLVLSRGCEAHRLEASSATAALAEAMSRIDRGSPSSDEALGAIALTRGDALWRIGRAREAVLAFDAGLPRSLPAPALDEADLAALDTVPELARQLEWREAAAISDPRRLVYLEGLALRAASRPRGDELIARARELGLTEPASQ